MTRARWALALAMCGILGGESGQSLRAEPVATQEVLLELFTSEGCESCPPADELLIDLVRKQSVPGVHIAALSEHVDYWNHLGWTDPFSAELYSKRQIEYGKSLRVEAYTPQVVVDGRAAVIGSSRADVVTALRKAAITPKAAVQLSWVAGAERTLQITMPVGATTASSRVSIAITEDRLSNQVKRGENEGRELRHDAVTRVLNVLGPADATGAFSRAVPVGPMIDARWKRDALHIIVFAQDAEGVVVALGQLASNN